MMPPSPLPDFVIPAVLLTWAFASGTAKEVKEGRLKGYSILTYFCTGAFIAGSVFVQFFASAYWKGISKFAIEGTCLALGLVCGIVTKKLPKKPDMEKRWRKARNRQ